MIVNLTLICSEINYDKFEITEFNKWSPNSFLYNNQINKQGVFNIILKVIIWLIMDEFIHQNIFPSVKQLIEDNFSDANKKKFRIEKIFKVILIFCPIIVIYFIYGFFNDSKIVKIKNHEINLFSSQYITNIHIKILCGIKRMIKNCNLFSIIIFIILSPVILIILIVLYILFVLIFMVILLALPCMFIMLFVDPIQVIRLLVGLFLGILISILLVVPAYLCVIPRYEYDDINLKIPTVEQLEQYLKNKESNNVGDNFENNNNKTISNETTKSNEFSEKYKNETDENNKGKTE